MSNKKAMRFAIIRFIPHIQTQEFANIGIVLVCPKSGWFGYMIEKRYGRLSQFFKYFNPGVFKAARLALIEELKQLQQQLSYHNGKPDDFRFALDYLARPRETVIQFSNISTNIAENEEQELKRLFDYYIGCSFAKEQKEDVLTRDIQDQIRRLDLRQPFKEEVIGSLDSYHVRLPLVQTDDTNQIRKIIKPLYLGQEDISEIYTKADRWISRFRRMKDYELIDNPAILLPYESAESPTHSQEKALKEVLDDLKRTGLQPVRKSDYSLIRKFAEAV